jgi:hypothetical protein
MLTQYNESEGPVQWSPDRSWLFGMPVREKNDSSIERT